MSKPWDQWLTQTGPYTEERLHPLGQVLFQMTKINGKWTWKVFRVEPYTLLAVGVAWTKRGAPEAGGDRLDRLVERSPGRQVMDPIVFTLVLVTAASLAFLWSRRQRRRIRGRFAEWDTQEEYRQAQHAREARAAEMEREFKKRLREELQR